MTREDIDRTLADLLAGETRALSPSTKTITGLGMLAEIVAEQERRLRVLEPCEMSPLGTGAPHQWTVIGCAGCGVRR